MRVASGNNPSLHAETAYSTPCGYIQTILYAKATGYLGLGVHPEALVQHTLEEGNITISGNKVIITNPDVNFNDLMNENSAYVPVLHFGNEVIALPLNRDGWKKPGASWTKHSIKVDEFDLKDVSNIPFSGVFSIYYESSKTPSYITVSSKH